MTNLYTPIPIYLKIEKVCNRYDIGKTWIYKAIKENRFPPPRRFGNNSRWSLSDLQEWEANNGLSDTKQSREALADSKKNCGKAIC